MSAFRGPAAIHDRDRLGERLHVLARSRLWVTQLLAAAFLLLFGGALVALCLQIPIRSSRDLPIAIAVIALFGILPAFALWWLVRTVRSRDLRLEIYTGGLAHRRAGRETVVLWDEVRELFIARMIINGVEAHAYRLITNSGARLAFTRELDQIHTIREVLERETTQRMVPAAEKILASGGVVSFGPFVVTPTHLGFKKKSLAWSELEMSVEAGRIRIVDRARKKTWAQPWSRDIPNAATLLELVRRR